LAFPSCSGHLTAEGDGATKEYHNINLVNAVFTLQEAASKLGQITDAKEAGEGVGGFCQASQVGVAALQTVDF
jgi:hypothetical protein